MALPILDGNQSPTTLSTIIISNAHVPAHTVTSLGTQAITDIATAVSGVELGPNTLNALENITVTLGQVTITGGLTDTQLRASAVTVGGTITVGSIVTHGVTIANSSVTIGGSVTATISGTPSVTFTQASVTFGTAVITGSTSIIGTPSVTFTQIATHGVTIGAGTAQIGSVTASISGTPSVTFGTAVITGSTSILNFPATQTVTFTQAPVTFGTAVITGSTSIIGTSSVTFTQASVTFGTATITGSTSILNFPATQTVTFTQITTHGVTIANTSVTVNGTFYQATQPVSLTTLPALVAGTAQIGSVTASISGTPSVTFTTATVTGSVSILNFPATQTVTFTQIATHGVTIGAGTAQIGSVTASISGTPSVTFTQIATHGVTIANSSVTIGGTVGVDNAGWKLLYSRNWNSDQSLFAINTTGYSELRFQSYSTGGVSSYLTIYSQSTGDDVYWSINNLGFSANVTVPNEYVGTMIVEMNDWDSNENQATQIFGRTSASVVTALPPRGGNSELTNFTSLTATGLAPASYPNRSALTVFNEGAGMLYISPRYNVSTSSYMVRLSAGDYWECPIGSLLPYYYAVFGSAGTARVTQIY